MKRKLQTLIHWFMANWCNKIRVSETKLPNDISDTNPRVHLTHYAFVRRLVLLFCIFIVSSYVQAQSVIITGTLKGFRHNWDCGNDGADGFITGNNNPEPRYKVWVGYDGGNFQQSTNNPGLYCGASNYTYGADGQSCSTWNPGDITLPTLTGNASTYNVVRRHIKRQPL